MTDYSELKRLAEVAPEGPWFGPEYAPGTSYVFDVDLGTLLAYEGIDSEKDACLRYVAAANPATILALIAENDLLRGGLHDIAKKASESRSLTRRLTWIEGRAESALLGKPWAAHVFMMPDPKNGKPKAERLEAENKQLKAENEALRKAANDLRRFLTCEDVHHDKPDWHEADEPCRVLARFDAAMSQGERE